MTDHELLQHMGVTKDELRDLHQKVHNFLHSGELNEAQKTAFKKSLKTPAHGAAELGGDVTPDRLTKFLQEVAPQGGPLITVARTGTP